MSDTRYRIRRAYEQVQVYRSMASGKYRYDAVMIERAKAILARMDELQATGMDQPTAMEQAIQEHPMPPRRGYEEYRTMGER